MHGQSGTASIRDLREIQNTRLRSRGVGVLESESWSRSRGVGVYFLIHGEVYLVIFGGVRVYNFLPPGVGV